MPTISTAGQGRFSARHAPGSQPNMPPNGTANGRAGGASAARPAAVPRSQRTPSKRSARAAAQFTPKRSSPGESPTKVASSNVADASSERAATGEKTTALNGDKRWKLHSEHLGQLRPDAQDTDSATASSVNVRHRQDSGQMSCTSTRDGASEDINLEEKDLAQSTGALGASSDSSPRSMPRWQPQPDTTHSVAQAVSMGTELSAASDSSAVTAATAASPQRAAAADSTGRGLSPESVDVEAAFSSVAPTVEKQAEIGGTQPESGTSPHRSAEKRWALATDEELNPDGSSETRSIEIKRLLEQFQRLELDLSLTNQELQRASAEIAPSVLRKYIDEQQSSQDDGLNERSPRVSAVEQLPRGSSVIREALKATSPGDGDLAEPAEGALLQLQHDIHEQDERIARLEEVLQAAKPATLNKAEEEAKQKAEEEAGVKVEKEERQKAEEEAKQKVSVSWEEGSPVKYSPVRQVRSMTSASWEAIGEACRHHSVTTLPPDETDNVVCDGYQRKSEKQDGSKEDPRLLLVPSTSSRTSSRQNSTSRIITMQPLCTVQSPTTVRIRPRPPQVVVDGCPTPPTPLGTLALSSVAGRPGPARGRSLSPRHPSWAIATTPIMRSRSPVCFAHSKSMALGTSTCVAPPTVATSRWEPASPLAVTGLRPRVTAGSPTAVAARTTCLSPTPHLRPTMRAMSADPRGAAALRDVASFNQPRQVPSRSRWVYVVGQEAANTPRTPPQWTGPVTPINTSRPLQPTTCVFTPMAPARLTPTRGSSPGGAEPSPESSPAGPSHDSSTSTMQPAWADAPLQQAAGTGVARRSKSPSARSPSAPPGSRTRSLSAPVRSQSAPRSPRDTIQSGARHVTDGVCSPPTPLLRLFHIGGSGAAAPRPQRTSFLTSGGSKEPNLSSAPEPGISPAASGRFQLATPSDTSTPRTSVTGTAGRGSSNTDMLLSL